MAFFKLCILAAAAVSVTLAQTEPHNSSKVNVTVYYESLCPDSMAFITKQLVPTMNSGLKDHINVTLVPFGKSNITVIGDNITFSCHHGPKECVGNKNQACLIQKTNQDDQLKVIDCLMQAETLKKNEYPLQECAKKANLPEMTVKQITDCVNSNEADQVLEMMGNKTNFFQNPLQNVPAVAINKEQDNNAIRDLKTVVCSKLNSTLVSACKDSKNAATSYQKLSAPVLAIIAAMTLMRL